MTKYKTTVFSVQVPKGKPIVPEDPTPPAGKDEWKLVTFRQLPNQFDASKIFYVAVWEQVG